MAFYMNMMALNEARTKEEYEAEKKKKQEEQDKKDNDRYSNRASFGSGYKRDSDQRSPNRVQFLNKQQFDQNKSNAERNAKAVDMLKSHGTKGMDPKAQVDAASSISKHLRKNEKKTVKQESSIFDECYFLDEE